MELIREEMTLLAEVDQPGSLIDIYVQKLATLLQQKLEGDQYRPSITCSHDQPKLTQYSVCL